MIVLSAAATCLPTLGGNAARMMNMPSAFVYTVTLRTPKEQWFLDPDEVALLKERWDPLLGDRMTELVFIGIDMDEKVIRATLDRCVLTSAEIAEGFDGWASHRDPLPRWDLGDET